VTAPNEASVTWQGEDLILTCRLQPKAAKDEFTTLGEGQLKIRITAAPVDGKANRHLVKYLAKQFKVPQDRVTIMSGENSRQKRIKIARPQCIPQALGLDFPPQTAIKTETART
jgi:uncharacterized protein (TIGR00251 family)